MRLLLVAYEFPPGSSPQALRWTYLVRELALRGHEVHVLAPRIPAYGSGLPALPPTVRVYRTFAGPLMGFIESRSARGADAAPAAGRAPTTQNEELNWKGRIHVAGLNWKGRLFEQIKAVWGYCLFPDIRAEWNPWARPELDRLLRSVKPDVVLASHEPASCLAVALGAGQHRIPLVVDLGDPVLAPYTPPRWCRRALAIERRVMNQAAHVFVTTEKARAQLQARHASEPARCTVLTQGFDDRARPGTAAHATEATQAPDAVLRLLYTGSFYDFRRADVLLDALRHVAGVHLSIASTRVPEVVARFATARPDRLHILGYIDHSHALVLQRKADVLVNLSNTDPVQIPGKLYEYLGACRPILNVHAATGPGDAAGELIARLARGWSCAEDGTALRSTLQALADQHRAGRLHDGLDLGIEAVADYSWRSLAARVEAVLHEVQCRVTGPAHSINNRTPRWTPP